MEELMKQESDTVTVIIHTDYVKYKEELREELQKAAESFVKIGYLLKVARDTGILADSGYANVNEFAEKEFGLDKTQVSRFIRINDRFSEDGYSERLKEEYRGFGYAKLAIMLMLPDAINEGLSPSYSKAEIQAIKDEVDEENKVSDIERMLEPTGPGIVEGLEQNTIGKVILQLGEDEPELFVEMAKRFADECWSVEDVKEVLAPQGEKTYSVRVPGSGRMMLMLNDEAECRIVNSRTGEKEMVGWGDIGAAWLKLMQLDKNPEERWSELYCKPYPKKEEVAPVQPKKESKVTKAKPEKKPEKKVETKKENPPEQQAQEPETMTLHEIQEDIPAPSPIPEEETKDEIAEDTKAEDAEEQQVPGQDSIENHPEYMPEPEETMEYLQNRAYQIVQMSLEPSTRIWKEKKMPLDVIQRNKENSKRVVELFEKMEKLAEREEA